MDSGLDDVRPWNDYGYGRVPARGAELPEVRLHAAGRNDQLVIIQPFGGDSGYSALIQGLRLAGGLHGIRHRQNKCSRNETASHPRKSKLAAIGRQGRHDVIQGGSLVRLRNPRHVAAFHVNACQSLPVHTRLCG
jgi:hypothetical protein